MSVFVHAQGKKSCPRRGGQKRLSSVQVDKYKCSTSSDNLLQKLYLTYIEYMLIAYYVIGIRNLSSVKIVTIVFILGTKKIGTPANIYGFSI